MTSMEYEKSNISSYPCRYCNKTICWNKEKSVYCDLDTNKTHTCPNKLRNNAINTDDIRSNKFENLDKNTIEPKLEIDSEDRLYDPSVYGKEEIVFEENYNNNENKEKNGNHVLNKETDLITIVKQSIVELFIDEYKIPHVAIKINDHTEIISLNNRRFKYLLFKICNDYTKKPNTEKIESILNVLKAEAEFSENIKKLNVRVAKTDDFSIYYDLTNSKWESIKITTEGWEVDKKTPVLFKRYNNQQQQEIPAVYHKDDIFDRFIDLLNVKDEKNKLLLKCYMISLFIPELSKPILILHGEQGSAKSTLQELIKMLVDPSVLRTLIFPKDINELIQKLAHNYIAYFDNISNIQYWISDVLCRAVTGSGFSKRELYTDDDDIIYTFKRCTGINGINLGTLKADLLDRSIIIQLERIPKERRKKIAEIWNKFNDLKSELLGYIFHILVKVLQVKKQGGITLPDGFNRMADFEEFGEIISRCMGNEENRFLQAYQDNIGIQIDEAIDANPLSTVILQFMNERNCWEGTA
ncbi:MAG: hypothetical protein ACPKPY_08870, partial [Nitrososphaeraceae archaeon]